MKCRAVFLFILVHLLLIFETFSAAPKLVTRLDRFTNIFLLLRHVSMNYTFGSIDKIFAENVRLGKVQAKVPDSQPFPCDVKNTRSVVAPTSVSQVRPGDIDVIACMGDSLSAANGGISTNIPHIINEFRSIAFSGGGRANWRKYVTLPNILKVFNPNLYGYATSDGPTANEQSRLSIAEPMLMSRDLTYQVKTLIKRMRSDPNINMKNHWKLLTIFVGNNDICSDMCHHDHLEDFLVTHENDLLKSLRMLRTNVPRLIVNILPPANMELLYNMKGIPNRCKVVHKVGCHCIFKAQLKKKKLFKYFNIIKEWQHRETQIVNMMEFQTQDFAVIFQPFMTNISLPLDRRGNTDLRMFASDCFHLSQLGHAMVANSLWNNMMQPDGFKQLEVYPLFDRFECPTLDNPFIATKGNSRFATSKPI